MLFSSIKQRGLKLKNEEKNLILHINNIVSGEILRFILLQSFLRKEV